MASNSQGGQQQNMEIIQVIFLDSPKLKIVWKKNIFKQRVSIKKYMQKLKTLAKNSKYSWIQI